jgi:hypothetical protein
MWFQLANVRLTVVRWGLWLTLKQFRVMLRA